MSSLTPRTRNACTPYGSAVSGGATPPPAGVPPTITVAPTNQTVTAPASATFTVTATGDAPLSYAWHTSWGMIAYGAPFILTPTNTGMSGATVYVVVTNAYGTATSAAVTLTVNPAVGTPAIPVIGTDPLGFAVQSGTSGTRTMVAACSSGYPDPTWVWYEGVPGLGTQLASDSVFPTVPSTSVQSGSSTLVFDLAQAPLAVGSAVSRSFYAVATNASGSDTSAEAVMQITPVSANVTVAIPLRKINFRRRSVGVSAGATSLVIKRPTTLTRNLLQTGTTDYTISSAMLAAMAGTGTGEVRAEVYGVDGMLQYTVSGWPAFTFSAPPTLIINITDIVLLFGRSSSQTGGVPTNAQLDIGLYENTTLQGSLFTLTSSTVAAWLAANPGAARYITFTPPTSITSVTRLKFTITAKADRITPTQIDDYIQMTNIYIQGAP